MVSCIMSLLILESNHTVVLENGKFADIGDGNQYRVVNFCRWNSVPPVAGVIAIARDFLNVGPLISPGFCGLAFSYFVADMIRTSPGEIDRILVKPGADLSGSDQGLIGR